MQSFRQVELSTNELTVCVCPVNVLITCHVFGFQILIVLSLEPDAKLPSGRTVNVKTLLVCPINVLINFPSNSFKVVVVVVLAVVVTLIILCSFFRHSTSAFKAGVLASYSENFIIHVSLFCLIDLPQYMKVCMIQFLDSFLRIGMCLSDECVFVF